MTAYSGHLGKIYVTGTSTALSAEACSLVSGNTYQVTDSAKRVLDPAVAVVVWGNGLLISAANYTLDYLFGRIRFTAPPTAPVTINSGSYLPLLEITTATKWTFSEKSDILVGTKKGDAVVRRVVGARDATFTLDGLEVGGHDHDSGAGTVRLNAVRDAGTVKVFDLFIGGTSSIRIAALIGSNNFGGDTGSLVSSSISASLAGVKEGADVSFSDFMNGGY